MLFATNHPARRRRRREYRVVEFRGAPAIPGPSTTSSLRRGPTTSGLPTASRRRRTLCCGRGVPPLGSRAGDTGHGVLGRLAVSQFYRALEALFRKSRTRAWCHSLPQLRPTPNHRRTPRPRQGSPHPIRTHHRDRPPTHRVGRHRHHPCAATKKKSAAYENQKPTKCTLNS
jgi:hypothetical protein